MTVKVMETIKGQIALRAEILTSRYNAEAIERFQEAFMQVLGRRTNRGGCRLPQMEKAVSKTGTVAITQLFVHKNGRVFTALPFSKPAIFSFLSLLWFLFGLNFWFTKLGVKG